ncbi:MAG: nucleotide sugar dehydrogenase [Dehalococcoidia bacterium]|nr:nucleotide sugar dehydrogenase [Dehalococcoidia bacterium]
MNREEMQACPPSSIAVVGCGHVGLVTAAGMASLGHQVVGIDKNPDLVQQLSRGSVPFLERGLPELTSQMLAEGRLTFTTSYTDALREAKFVFLCVNTPPTATGAPDIRYVRMAAAALGEELATRGRQPIIINKSTSPIGTGERIDAILSTFITQDNGHSGIVANPEFLREGSAVYDFFHPDRIVIGADSEVNAQAVAQLYEGIDAPLVMTDLRSAEMIKYVSNAYLATRVSFVNEIARLCEALNLDVDPIVTGAGMDPRIGQHFFKPGIGYGGSCLPKDVAALCYTGDSAGISMRLLSSVQEINLGQRRHAVQCLRQALGTLEGRTIAVWGITFKGGSEDLRESPALDVIRLLQNEGARIQAYDPSQVTDGDLEDAVLLSEDAIDAVKGADALAVLTDWPEFTQVDFAEVLASMPGRYVYDGRNILKREHVEAVGGIYQGMGRPITHEGQFHASVSQP